MALSEFVAMEAAYRALQSLDGAARGRALRWLTDALGVSDALPEAEDVLVGGGVSAELVSEAVADAADAAVADGAVAGTAVGETAVADAVVPAAGVNGADAATAGSAPAVTESATADEPTPVAATSGRNGATVPAPRSSRRRAAAGTATTRRRGKAASVPEVVEPERVYRRMPPVDEVLDAYRQIGTISGLAGHFGVPRHTVQGWARRLRRAGHEIGRNA